MEKHEVGNSCAVTQPPPDRPQHLKYLTIVGPEIELDSVIEYVSSPFATSTLELPAFEEQPSLGNTALVINLDDHQLYKTEVGVNIGEYKRFYLPQDYPALVNELMFEGKRIKNKRRESNL